MRGQLKLLSSFKKYFLKYLPVLILFVLFISFSSLTSAYVSNMESSYEYHENAMQKARGSVYLGRGVVGMDKEDILTNIEIALKRQEGVLSYNVWIPYSPISIYLTKGDENVFLKAFPSTELKGDEFLTFSEYLINDEFFSTSSYAWQYHITPIRDDKKAQKLNLNTFEAYISQERYEEIVLAIWGDLFQFTNVTEPRFDFVGELDLESFAKDIKSLFTRKVRDISIVLNIGEGDEAKTFYRLENNTSIGPAGYYQLNEVYRSPSIYNKIDLINTPLALLEKAIIPFIMVIIVSSIFVTLSVFASRKKEYLMYSNLGMSKRKIYFLTFVEELIMLLVTIVMSVLIVLSVYIFISIWSPKGPLIVSQSGIYFRDIFAIGGRYSIKGIWKPLLQNTALLAVVFTCITTSINFILLRKNDKERKSL